MCLQGTNLQTTAGPENHAGFIWSNSLPQSGNTFKFSAKTTRRASITLFQVWRCVLIELLIWESLIQLKLRGKNVGIRQTSVQIPALPLTVCETLDKRHSLPVLSLFICKMGIVIAPTSVLWGGVNEIIHINVHHNA